MDDEVGGRVDRLRRLLFGDGLLVLPGVVDPWAARLAEQAGFDAVFMTGAGIANATYGVPDIGLIGLSEMADAVGRIAGSVSVPLVADGDTGYGNALNVYHAARRFRDAGAAAMTIEDQVMPKRCGHLVGKAVVPVDDMREKIVAFREARGESEMVLIARTDAIAVEGFTGAVDRAQAYAEAGADLVFVEAPTDDAQLRAIPGLLPVPAVINMVEGGFTPLHPVDELEQMGYAAAIYANAAMRVAGTAMQSLFRHLRTGGDTRDVPMMTWQDRQALAGLPGWKTLEDRIVEVAAAGRPAARLNGSGAGRSEPRD